MLLRLKNYLKYIVYSMIYIYLIYFVLFILLVALVKYLFLRIYYATTTFITPVMGYNWK